MTVTPYALMGADPCRETFICWIDERSGATSAPQTLAYGSGQSATSTVVALPGGSVFHHHVHLTGLTPGTLVPLSLPDAGVTFPPVKMLPLRVPPAGIRGLSVSDTHCGRRAVNTPALFSVIGAERPDFIIMAGDSSGERGSGDLEETANSTAIHVASFRDYFSQWWADGDFLPQMLCDAGNHWVNNGNSDGVSLGDATLGVSYYDWFHPNAKAIPPVGDRHMVATAGNWLQVISGDLYSNTVASAAANFLASHDAAAGLCIFLAHSPMLSQGNRLSNDPVIQANLRNALFKAFYERENVRFTFGGNIHLDTITKPLSWYSADPGFPSVALSDGWLAPAPDGDPFAVIEFGEGHIGGRPLQASPLVPAEIWDRLERDPQNYYLMHFTPGRVFVEDKDTTGARADRAFGMPFLERADGALARAYAANGAPVYPRRAA